MKLFFLRALLILGTLGLQSARAADTDLFALGHTGPADASKVLFVLDNAANFSASVSDRRCSITAAGVVSVDGTGTAPTNLDKTAGAVEQCALYTAIQALEANSEVSLKIGVMGFNANGMKDYDPLTNTFPGNCVGGTGGCLLMSMVPFNSTTKPRILEWIRLWATSGNSNYVIKANNAANGATMQEAWAFYKGKVGLSGRDYANTAPAAGCGKSNVIFIGNDYRNNATAGDGTNANNGPRSPLLGLLTGTAAGKNANPAATAAETADITDTVTTSCGTSTLSTAEGSGAYALKWARYMKGQNILTYSVGVLGPTCNASYAAHLKRLGDTDVGGARFFGTTDFEELVTAIQTALSEIKAADSAFASVSLPVNANMQGEYLNQVFVGVFRPDAKFLPQWPGNMKQYRLSNSLKLVDAKSESAINTATGFLSACARSYWTSATADTYWTKAPSGTCLSSTPSSDSPDGPIVEKGAQASRLRATAPTERNVKTCSDPATFSSCTLTDFKTTTTAITQALLNPGGTNRDEIINWVRGTNVDGTLAKTTTEMRPYVHGDVLHSRPVAVSHGTGAVVVYYGANDGMLRAVNGNRGDAVNDPDGTSVGTITSGGKTFKPGEELWSFMPSEFYGKIYRQRKNTEAVSYPGTPVTGSTPKPYGMDGPVSALQMEGRTFIYAAMRRGGRAVYALETTTPGTPALLWKKGCPNESNNTGCSFGFTGIGQTWSTLKPMYVTGHEAGIKPLLIMGGGYDSCEDYDARSAGGANHNCTSPKGNKVYVLDALTGAIIKTFNTDRSVIADTTIVTDGQDKAIYAYTADMGGNVYRMSFAGASADWSITKIASLGCPSTSPCPANRKFGFQPSVVTSDGLTYYVMLGSGEREKPVEYYTSSQNVANAFFMVMDKPADVAWPDTTATCNQNIICKDSLLNVTNLASPSASDMAGKKGWYLNMAAGEQVVTSALTIFGETVFSTHKAVHYVEGVCTPSLGDARLYKRNYKYGKTMSKDGVSSELITGGGLVPSPVGGRVQLDNGQIVPFCIGCDASAPLEGSLIKANSEIIQPKNRLYWYIQK